MSDTGIDLNDFLGDGLADAFSEGVARFLPPGEYRWKIRQFSAESSQFNGVPVKEIVAYGVNADTGEKINRKWRLTDKNGQVNRIQATMLGEQFIKSGITVPLKRLLSEGIDIPVVTLRIGERTDANGKVYPTQDMARCEDQKVNVIELAKEDADGPF